MEPIHFAAQGGHVGIVNTLVNEYGVDPNSKVSYLCIYSFTFSYNNIYNNLVHIKVACTYN